MTTTKTPSDAGLEIGELLSIDVAAEVRKLSRAQIESPAQIAVELVRRSLGAGAARTDVACGRRAIAIRDDGPPLPAPTLDALASLLDPSAAQTERHRALLLLEASGDLALLALAGIGYAALRVRSGGRVLTARRGERPTLAATPGSGTTVEISGAPLDAADVRTAVAAAGRFARVPITVDGSPLSATGFGEVVAEERFDSPLPGRVAIPATGDTARVWILLDGLAAAHLALPGMPCFEASIDGRALFPRGTPLPPPSALREAVEPHLEKITARALDLVERVAAGISGIPADRHARVRELVLAAARKKLRTSAMRRAPVFRAHGDEQKRFSIDDLDALGSSASRGLVALFPEQDPKKFLLPAGAVPILDTVERGRLQALIGVSFRPPPPRRTEGGTLAALRTSLASIRHGAGDLLRRVRHPFEGRAIADGELSDAERDFLATVREHVMTDACEEIDVRFVAGAGPVRQLVRPRPALLLPRANPVVQAALRSLGGDRRWIYPVALALEAIPRPATRSLYWR